MLEKAFQAKGKHVQRQEMRDQKVPHRLILEELLSSVVCLEHGYDGTYGTIFQRD